MCFKAHQTTIVNSAFYGVLNDNANYIATIFSPDWSLLMGGPTIVLIYDNLKCAIAVTNMAPYDIYLQRGAIIGLIKMEDKLDKSLHWPVIKWKTLPTPLP